jgi:hypothetical protein
MSVDLTGGLSDDREFVFATQPDDPEMRESVNIWAWDNGTEFGMPRIGVEAVADQWETHDIQVNIAFADGRVFNLMGTGEVHDPLGADGRPRTLGAGPLSFELLDPFRHWRARFDGEANQTSIQAQIDGWTPGRGSDDRARVELDLDIKSAAPPWESGTLLEEAGRVLATQEEGDLMGGPRFEQLFRATGRLRVGDEVHDINGGGLRIRRRGVRRLAAFRGHVWQSAVFPSGRAFGLCLYPDRTDGKPTFNEGYLFEGDGTLVPARVTDAPWLEKVEPRRQDASVTLVTEAGTTRIEGETILSTCYVMGPPMIPQHFSLQQAIAAYRWDGETANGMLERSVVTEQSG